MTNVIIYKTGRQTLDFKVCRMKGSQKYLRLWCKENKVTYSLIISEEQLIKDSELELDKLIKKYGNKLYLFEFLKKGFEIEEVFDHEKYNKNVEQYDMIGCQNKRHVFEWLKEQGIILEEYTHVYDLVDKYNMPYQLTLNLE